MSTLTDIGTSMAPYWADPLKAVNVQMLCRRTPEAAQ